MEEPPTSNSHPPPPADKHAEDPTSNKTSQCSVTVYLTKIAGVPRNVTVLWSKNLMNHSLTVSIDKSAGQSPFSCKVDLKPWPFWSKKGLKSFEIDGKRVDVFWDLRSAKFSGGAPEPSGGYYVALVCGEEVALLVGDCKKEAYKRTKSRPSLEDAALVSKRENVFGKKCFAARAKFDGSRKKDHDIVVENSIAGPADPEMWISVDGVVLIHVDNLQWKFRGNKVVYVEKAPVQVFWDVHDWLFGGPGNGQALFIFKPGLPEPVAAAAAADDGFTDRNAAADECPTDCNAGAGAADLAGTEGSSGTGAGGIPDFCFLLYAWKTE